MVAPYLQLYKVVDQVYRAYAINLLYNLIYEIIFIFEIVRNGYEKYTCN